MGLCNSCESTRVSTATAKVILPDGRLQEYPYPVKASFVLQKHPAIFICNSDDMEFHDVACAVADDEVLHPGQLYFALPLTRLQRPLKPEEMAALAVQASSALMKSTDKCGFGLSQVSPVGISGDREVKSPRRTGSGGGGLRRGVGSGGKGQKFTAMLRAIPE